MAQQRNVGIVLSLRDQFTAPLRRSTRSVNTLRSSCRQMSADARRTAKSFTDSFKTIAKASAFTASAGLALFAKESISLASDLREVQNVVDVTFGESASTINDFANNSLKNFGLTKLEAKRMTGTFGALFKSAGIGGKDLIKMSKGMTELAGDFSSFYNLKPEEAFNKLRAGISGESEPLKALGINMSVANLETFRRSKGIKKLYKNMSEAEKQQLRYNFILSAGKDAVGDYARTSDSWANQTKLLTSNIADLGASIGEKVLPYLENWIGTINENFPNLRDQVVELSDRFIDVGKSIGKGIAKYFDKFTKLANKLSEIKDYIFPIVAGFTLYKGVMKASAIWSGIATFATGLYNAAIVATEGNLTIATIAQWGFNSALKANPIGMVIAGITALVLVGIYLYKHWDEIKAGTLELWETFKKGISNAINPLIDGFIALYNSALESFTNMKNGFLKIVVGIKDGFMNSFNSMKNGLFEIINSMIKNINKLIETINLIPSVDIGTIPEIDTQKTVKQESISDIGKVGRNALGTDYWRGGLTTINEAGKEIINLPSGTQIVPANQTQNNQKEITINMGGITLNNCYGLNEEEITNIVMGRATEQLKLALDNQF